MFIDFFDKGFLWLHQLINFVVLLTGREPDCERLVAFRIGLEFWLLLILTICFVLVVLPWRLFGIIFAISIVLLCDLFGLIQINSQLLKSLSFSTWHVIELIVSLLLLIITLWFLLWQNMVLSCCIILNQPASLLPILPAWTRVLLLYFTFDFF